MAKRTRSCALEYAPASEPYPVEYRSIAGGSSNKVISSVFNQVLLTRDPRLLQIGIKLNF